MDMRDLMVCVAMAVSGIGWDASVAGAADTAPADGAKGVSIVAGHTAVFKAPPRHVPSNKTPDGPLLGNGDVGVVLGGSAELQTFYLGKNDFWSRSGSRVKTVGRGTLDIPALKGASYHQEQDLLHAEVRGRFAKAGLAVQTRSWVQADENLLVTELSAKSSSPMEVCLHILPGPGQAPAMARLRENGRPVRIGREEHGRGRWYFHGLIDDVRVYDRALSAEEAASLQQGREVTAGLVRHWSFDEGQGDLAADTAGKTKGKIASAAWAEGTRGKALRCDGKATFVDAGPLRVRKAVSIAAWVRPAGPPADRVAYILSKGDWNHAYSLGLSYGKLRMAIGEGFAQAPASLAADRWQHVVGTFDGRTIRVYVDGKEASAGAFAVPPDAAAGHDNGMSWFTRRADPPTVPAGRTVAAACRVFGAEVSVDEAGFATLRVPRDGTVTIVTAIQTDLDARPAAPLAAVKARLAGLRQEDLPGLIERHRAWWRAFWSRSFLEIPDKLIEQHWYGSLYIMGSCSRGGKVPPGLFGNWITTDNPAWRGDFHLNYNHEAPFWGLYAANHVDTASSYETPVMAFLPFAQANARELLTCRGVYYPVGIGPWGINGKSRGFLGQKSNASYAATNMVMRWRLTHDRDYASRIAYPFLREVASFWEDYLKFEPAGPGGQAGGRYVIYNDAIHENHTPHDMNPLLSLGLVRMVFRAVLDMSEELGADAKRRATWKHILAHLSAYPLQQRDGKTVFRYSEKGQDWFPSNTLGIQHIFPAGTIGLDSEAKLLAVSRDTITVLNRWTDFNGFPTFYTAAARVGYDPTKILKEMHAQCEKHAFANLHIFHGGGGIEDCSGIMLAPIEMLMQSHEGVIRLFPCWPKGESAGFGGLRARGAFLVSSRLTGGQVQYVRLRSEQGRPCTLVNPWSGKAVAVHRPGKDAHVLRGERVTFATGAGEEIWLGPEGVSLEVLRRRAR